MAREKQANPGEWIEGCRMFELWCPTDRQRVLRWSSHVVHVAHPASGAIDLIVRCGCGAHVLWRTGRARTGRDEFVHGINDLVAA